MIFLCHNGMQVNVINNIPADFPSAADGISIHWHGFSMRGNEWYDGTGHIAQCPILPGANFTYYFQVSHTDDLCMSSCVKCSSRRQFGQGKYQCAGLGFSSSACCSKSCSMHSWSVLLVLSTSPAPAEHHTYCKCWAQYGILVTNIGPLCQPIAPPRFGIHMV